MVAFLSDAWIAALDEAASTDEALRERTAGLYLTVEQRVDGGPEGDVVYHVSFDNGTTRVIAGPAPAPDVRFRQDHATAVAVATGELSAQRAFMAGRLQVGGDLRTVIDRGDALAALHDVFVSVRAATTGLDRPVPVPSPPT